MLSALNIINKDRNRINYRGIVICKGGKLISTGQVPPTMKLGCIPLEEIDPTTEGYDLNAE